MATPDSHKFKVMYLFDLIRTASENCDCAIKEELISICGSKWGTARQTAQAYIKELESGKLIHIEKEDVWTSSRWEKILEARKQEDFSDAVQSIDKEVLENNGKPNSTKNGDGSADNRSD